MKHYLDLQSLRFAKPFEYSIDLDPGIQPDLIRVPSLLIQPLLENAIEHGLIPKKGGRLWVVIQQKQDYILVIVEDDGVGINHKNIPGAKKQDKNSLGNAIISERILLLNRKSRNKITFDIKNRADLDDSLSGTHACLKIPQT